MVERKKQEGTGDVALPDEDEARPIGEAVESLVAEIEKSGGSIATPLPPRVFYRPIRGRMRFETDSESHAGRPCSMLASALSSLDKLPMVAPMGSGFFFERFQREKVERATPAISQTLAIETPASLARCSNSVMIVS